MAALTAYVRKTGSDNNGGSTNGTSPERTGTDGVTNGTTTFTSLTASFTSGDVDKLINIVTKGRYRIATFVNSTTVTISGSPSAGTGLTWNLGGAVQTIGAILANANNAFQSVDFAIIGAGTYREVVTVSMTSATAETIIQGDIDGSKTGDAGDVIWTAYLTDDITAPSTSSLLTLNGRDFLTFKNILMIGGNNATASCVNGTTTNSVNIVLRDCAMSMVGGPAIAYTGLADIASNWTIDRCLIEDLAIVNASGISIILPTSASADYDSVFLIQNSVFRGGNIGININSSGALAFKGGGVDIFNCDLIHSFTSNLRTQNSISTAIPCTIYNSIIKGVTALNAGTSGQILEDNNRILANTARTNVTAGGASISDASHAPLIEFGYELISGRQLRPFGMPMAGSPLLGRGNTAGGPTVDILSRSRPSGGGSTSYAWGAYERHDTAAKETSVVQAGATAAKIVGPGDQDILIPVDASSTTISVYVRYDTNHGTTNKPQVQLLANGEIGVVTETKTATVGVDTQEQLTFSAFTPTAKGWVVIRCISRSAAGNGIAYFDTFSGGAQGTQGLDYWNRGEIFPGAVATGAGGSGGGPLIEGRLVR